MSIKALDWALDVKAPTSSAKFLLIVLADVASDAGVAWWGRRRLADVCQLNPATVTKHLADLESAGLIWRGERRRENGSRTSDWIVLAPNMNNRGKMLDADAEDFSDERVLAHAVTGQVGIRLGGQVANCDQVRLEFVEGSGCELQPGQVGICGGPEPLEEPLEEPSEESTTPPARRIGGKPIDAARWKLTVQTLEDYCAQAGQRRSPTTNGGAPSDSAKRIYERLSDYPELSFEDLAQTIRATLASKWWGDDAPSVGVVFGPRIFEDNLNRRPVVRLPDGLRQVSDLNESQRADAHRAVVGARPGARAYDVDSGARSEDRLRSQGVELVIEEGRARGWRPYEAQRQVTA